MRLFRFGEVGDERPGVVLKNERKIDVSAFGENFDEHFFDRDGLSRLENWLTQNAASAPRVDENVRLGPPVARPSKIVCIGLNYRDHAEETHAKIPQEPVIFFKATSSLCGPNDTLVIPKNASSTDWEVELGVVVGRRTSYVAEPEAEKHVAGYALHNDYSEREFQLERAGQWVKGKSADTFAPLGPYLVTKDEIPDVDNLHMWLRVNGELKQESNTKNLIFKVPFLVSYISHFMTLLPGDVISTGTPGGVGHAAKPQQFLKPGDVVELGIDCLGTSRQTVVAYTP